MEKRQIAAILPAGKVFDRTFEAIVATEKDFGLTGCVRISTELSELQLASTLDQLRSSTVIIADLTARNPSVMFLAGCALGMKKEVRFITQHIEDFPLDRSTHPIVYGNDYTYLSDQIVHHYCGCNSLSNRAGNTDARSKFMSIFGDLLQKHGYEHRGEIVQEKPNVFTLLEQEMDLALVQEIARRGRERGVRVRLM